jgi:hypothetical protein
MEPISVFLTKDLELTDIEQALKASEYRTFPVVDSKGL